MEFSKNLRINLRRLAGTVYPGNKTTFGARDVLM